MKEGNDMTITDGKIHLPGIREQYLKPGQQPVVRLTPEAYNCLVDITNSSARPAGKVASEIIRQVQDRIIYDKE